MSYYDSEGRWILSEGGAGKDSKYIRGKDTTVGDAGYCYGCETFVPDGPDSCFGGYIPGVSFACCGHGVRGATSDHIYVVLGDVPNEGRVPDDRVVYRGKEATEWFQKNIKGWRKPRRTT